MALFRALKKTLQAHYTTKVNNRVHTSRGTTHDEQNKNGKTALMLAKEYGHTEVVQLLENDD